MHITWHIYNTFLTESQKSMSSRIRKWVCNAIAVPNPTQYTKFDKYMVTTAKVEIGPNTNFLYLLPPAEGPGGCRPRGLGEGPPAEGPGGGWPPAPPWATAAAAVGPG